MPRGDGFHLVKRLRAGRATQHVPILLVSAIGAPDRRAAGIELGADDFLTKPVDVRELLARVRGHLRRAQDRARLERRALIDPLTGVLNRRGICEVLKRELGRALRTGGPLSVLVVDVDHFKAINDRYGHQAGDTVLRHVARTLNEAVRIADHVGRSGGDEFLVVLPDTDGAAALTLGGRLHNLQLPPLAVEPAREVDVTISIGTATARPDDTSDTLVERADREMYRVKKTGELPAVSG
jgi:two-component system cell cycle response regulator